MWAARGLLTWDAAQPQFLQTGDPMHRCTGLLAIPARDLQLMFPRAQHLIPLDKQAPATFTHGHFR